MALSKDAKLASPQYVETFVSLVVNERKSMNSNAVLNYDVVGLIGPGEIDKYDLSTLDCQVWVHDADPASPVRYMDVPAYSVVTVGLDTGAGGVRIVNTFTTSINIMVRITLRRKKQVV